MAEAFKEFELIIDSSPEDFGKWLLSEAANLFNRPILYDETEWLRLHQPKLHSPNEGYPHYRFTLNATAFEEKISGNGEGTNVRYVYESAILVEIRKINDEKIHVLGYWTMVGVIEQFKILHEKIIQIFCPQMLNEEKGFKDRPMRPDMDNLPVLVFDFILKKTETNFINWFAKETGKLIPNDTNNFDKDVVFYNVPARLRKTSDENFRVGKFGTVAFLNGDFPSSYFSIIGYLIRVNKSSDFNPGMCVLLGLEVWEINDGRIHAICKCLEIPIILDIAENLLSNVIRVFKPEPVSNTHISIKQTQDVGNLKEPWERITDHLWDRKAVEMWWKGFTNKEIGQRVSIAARRVTNRISELRQIYGTDIVPY